MVELERFAGEPLEETELEQARRYLSGSFPRRASGVGGVAGLVSTAWLLGLPDDTWSDYAPRVAGLSTDRVVEAIARWVRPEAASIVLVGPRGPALAAVEGLGEAEEYSQDDRHFEDPAHRH
jgi:zinc protease